MANRIDPRYRKAMERHQCPPGYEGPCWGPTADDYAAVEAEAAAAELAKEDRT